MDKTAGSKKKSRKPSIIKLSIIGVIMILGIILSLCSFDIGLTTFKSTSSAIKLGLDLKGGVYAVYQMNETDNSDNISARMDGTRTRLQDLLTKKGYTEATVVREGSTRLRVEVPDVADPGNLFDIIGKPASLKFVLDETKETILTGHNITKAEVVYNNQKPVVSLELDDEGTAKFKKATEENIGKTMSIVSTVDDEETTISSPTINVAITNGKAIIEGDWTAEGAQNLADQIASGQFEVKLQLLESNTVSPTLGEKALMLGIIAGAVGLFLVMIFMCMVYRGLGVVASVSLIIYTILILLFLAILPWVQLTLPGIAGIILSLGMAVDGNVIIYERIKEENRNGKSVMASKNAGFKKAMVSIIDSNVTTIIAAVVLLIFGTGSIQGFAITLLVGIVLSMFSSLFITRKLLKYFLTALPNNPGFFGLKENKGSDYIINNPTPTDPSGGAMVIDSSIVENKVSSENTKGGLANENI